MGKFNYEVRDINLAPTGIEKIEWAYRNMPVLRAIEAELIEKQPFKGMKISVSVHVEAKTACLARALARGGADVALTGCNPLSTQDDVAAALAADGMYDSLFIFMIFQYLIYCLEGFWSVDLDEVS